MSIKPVIVAISFFTATAAFSNPDQPSQKGPTYNKFQRGFLNKLKGNKNNHKRDLKTEKEIRKFFVDVITAGFQQKQMKDSKAYGLSSGLFTKDMGKAHHAENETLHTPSSLSRSISEIVNMDYKSQILRDLKLDFALIWTDASRREHSALIRVELWDETETQTKKGESVVRFSLVRLWLQDKPKGSEIKMIDFGKMPVSREMTFFHPKPQAKKAAKK